MSMSRNRLVEVLEKVRTSATSREQLTTLVREALVGYGSATEDNVACAKHVEVDVVGDYQGLKLVGHDVLLTDVIASLEEAEVPDYVAEEFPSLTPDLWAAAIRATLLVLSAFENHIPTKLSA